MMSCMTRGNFFFFFCLSPLKKPHIASKRASESLEVLTEDSSVALRGLLRVSEGLVSIKGLQKANENLGEPHIRRPKRRPTEGLAGLIGQDGRTDGRMKIILCILQCVCVLLSLFGLIVLHRITKRWSGAGNDQQYPLPCTHTGNLNSFICI